jgi:hypothetical protein
MRDKSWVYHLLPQQIVRMIPVQSNFAGTNQGHFMPRKSRSFFWRPQCQDLRMGDDVKFNHRFNFRESSS